MSGKLIQTCPRCGEEREFYLAATTNLHLGKKKKWHCPECDYGFVQIDSVVDTRSSAEA